MRINYLTSWDRGLACYQQIRISMFIIKFISCLMINKIKQNKIEIKIQLFNEICKSITQEFEFKMFYPH